MRPSPLSRRTQAQTRFFRLLVGSSIYCFGIGLLLGFFTVFLVYYMISPLEEGGLGLEKSIYSITLALCVIAYMAAAIISGTVSDGLQSRYGNRIPFIITGGTLIAVLFIIAYLFLTNNNELWLLAIILFILISTARGISATPFQALMADLFVENTRGWVALARDSFMTLGTGIAVLIFPPLVKQYKYTEMFLIIAAAFLLVTLITGLTVPKANPRLTPESARTRIFKVPENLWTYGQGEFGKMLVCQIFWGLGTGTVKYFWVLFAKKRLNASIDETVIVLVFFTISAFLFALPVGFLTSMLGKAKVGIFSSILYMVFIFLMLTCNRVEELYLYALIGGMATVGLSTITQSLPADLVPEGKEAEFLGINTVFTMLPHPILLGFAAVIFGGVITQSEAVQFGIIFILAIIEIGMATLFLLWLEYEDWSSIPYGIFIRLFSKNSIDKIEISE